MSDIADKIQKLIAKARGTTNPTEAALFMNKATELMAANGLTMEAVDIAAIKEGRIRSRFSVSKVKDYEITLMHAIAASFGCHLMWQRSHSNGIIGSDHNYAEIIFVGPKDRLSLAVYAADVLARQLFKARQAFSSERSAFYWKAAADAAEMTVQEVKDDDADHIDGGCGQLRRMIGPRVTKEANSFAVGWVTEIRKKVTTFALNDKEQALIEAYTTQHSDPDAKSNHEQTELSMAAMMAGRAAAKDAQLHRPVGTNGEVAPLLGQTLAIGQG